MNKYLRYLGYVVLHKWFVLLECVKLGIPWQGLVHDLSKFYPSEWFPYAEHFYGKYARNKKIRDTTGYYKPTDTGDLAFDLAWLRHAHRNPHHWQWWTQVTDNGSPKVYPMAEKYRREMLADWCGASRAQRSIGVRKWYAANQHCMLLDPDTRNWIEEMLEKRMKLYKVDLLIEDFGEVVYYVAAENERDAGELATNKFKSEFDSESEVEIAGVSCVCNKLVDGWVSDGVMIGEGQA